MQTTSSTSDISLTIRLERSLLDRLERLTLMLRNNPHLAAELGTPGKITHTMLIELLLREGLPTLEARLLGRQA